MSMWCRVALCGALLAAAVAYTVDCNHEYTDCDTELSKLSDDDESPPMKATPDLPLTLPDPSQQSATFSPITTLISEKPTELKENTESSSSSTTQDVDPTEEVKPQPRLLNLNVDELQNFAIALHNQTDKSSKKLTDLSDVNLDDDEDEPPRGNENHPNKGISDKFFSNLQAPFHALMSGKSESSEIEACRENGIGYKIGEKMDRGCEETCECTSGGIFECSPRCKHPYIRRGRRLNDPLCFESPVDNCCSIIACATGNGDAKITKLEVCKYNNETYPVGAQWYLGCESTCICEEHSVVTCKPRCKPLSTSDKCINVQDPNDACCEVQVCDVSQDGHEIPQENVTTTSSTSLPTIISNPEVEGRILWPHKMIENEDEEERGVMKRPLVLAEPIGSIKVLQNNTVQVNLMHTNKSEDPIHLLLSSDGGKTFEDVELKYSNLILNLEGGKDYVLKTKETGTKFNFTITAADMGPAKEVNEVEELANITKVGCWEDGKFYEVGEEFKIGCTELCECTGPETRECVALVCPNHVGLEIMSKGCVKWAPSPPAQPPNCCPRSARCLSDGTCHYNGVPVPNWSEVPIALTGCEQRCFCENGDLDCQEVCSPLPPIPPQNLRCPPLHKPAAVNISDEDCCKQWDCVPISGSASMPVLSEVTNYVTPISPILPTITTQVLPTPPLVTDSMMNFYSHFNPFKSHPKNLKTKPMTPLPFSDHTESYHAGDNITVFSFNDLGSPFKTIQAEPPMVASNYWPNPLETKKQKDEQDKQTASNVQIHTTVSKVAHTHPEKHVNFVSASNSKVQNNHPSLPPLGTVNQDPFSENLNVKPKYTNPTGNSHEIYINPQSMSTSKTFNFFKPTHQKYLEQPHLNSPYIHKAITIPETIIEPPSRYFFEPVITNRTDYVLSKFESNPINPAPVNETIGNTIIKTPPKHVTVLKTKDLKNKLSDVFDPIWTEDTKTHVLTKQPNPYETVLLRAIQSPKIVKTSTSNQKSSNSHGSSKSYATIDLENLLSQMEVRSEVNRNLGRSADKNQGPAAGQPPQMPPGFPPHKPQTPAFLPTVPPDSQFPQEDIPDYDQNNIHHPSIHDQPGLPGLPPGIHGLPPGLQVPTSFGDMNKKLTVISIESDSPSSIKMLLGLPPVLVGLRGSVDLRYTDKADEDISHWYSQVFAPADEVLTTPRLEFRLTGLKPGTTYKIRGKLYLHNLPVSPESDTYTVRTNDLPTVVPVEEKRREINTGLTVIDVNDTTARVSWRHFSEDELELIDGIQVRYRPVGTPIYSMTELLHHSRSAAELHDLKPDSRYEASLVLIPPPRATTELRDPGRVEFTTAPYIDPYNWTVVIDVRSVGAEAAELTWHGVPSPAERWVRVYRAAHACGDQTAGKEHDEFRLAARDQPPSVTLTGLQPDTRCRVWLELFLTNGKVKTSNVLEINTKSLDMDNPIDNEIEASGQSANGRGRPQGDYYTALVGVGVVAALGALTSFLLLLVVVRRHRPHSVPITPVPSAPRESSLPPYDNPAYKLELQQETMDL